MLRKVLSVSWVLVLTGAAVLLTAGAGQAAPDGGGFRGGFHPSFNRGFFDPRFNHGFFDRGFNRGFFDPRFDPRFRRFDRFEDRFENRFPFGGFDPRFDPRFNGGFFDPLFFMP